ncbi:MAG: DNA recombination protein RmuC [Phycisphaerales bacterium]|nr:DNA recombination protein RmuC [Phycisphaerales bacterium]
MVWVVGLIALGVGALIGYLLGERRGRFGGDDLHTSLAVAEQRVGDLSAQMQAEQGQAQSLRNQLVDSEKQSAALSAQLQSAQQNIAEQKRLLDDAQVKLREAFAHVSAEALAKNNEAFLALARERFSAQSKEAAGSLDERKAQIEGMLKPMRELMTQYQLRLTEVERSRVESYSMLREQLGMLAEASRTLDSRTGQLVTALSRPSTRGQWGEVTLRRLMELAGMSNRCDFYEQESVRTEDGRQRPDVVVRLPGEREVVIDCKAVLDAFLDAAAATDEDQRKACLQRHSQQVRTRIRDLSAKAYWNQFKRTPEYVVMFLPGEAFLYAAVESDPTLIEEGFKNRVVVATPTTLIALLKTIEFGWRQEMLADNAEKIRALGVELYERVGTLAGHVENMGSSLTTAVSHYNKMLGSLESRVLVSARKMGELGARTDKAIGELPPVDVQPRELPAALEGQGGTS